MRPPPRHGPFARPPRPGGALSFLCVNDDAQDVLPRRHARRPRGIVQNVANQLAQMAVGWEITPDGPALPSDTDSGVITIDVMRETATVDGRAASLVMAKILARWTADELNRQQLTEGWLRSARVTVNYERSTQPGRLNSRATVDTAWGAAEAVSANTQLLPTDWPPR